ncbi:prostacyclin synthase-like [Brienomyrus brachyistius]|uniref:prostacyclin synthase-like n=1 Tax=Brienomyrus brachyistius TaxID=42636 RepID=UPI0020B420A0|nr:prostacyclin synthase-like [Brienomyrus brachyistius]
MIWTVLLLCYTLILLFVILSNRKRTKREPPLDKGVIPWLGHALEFGKDAAKFLAQMKDKHGDIFTVRVAGRYVTVLLDPNSYDAVLQNSASLDFSRYAKVLMERIFLLRLPQYDPVTERAAMNQHFHGENLTHLNATMHRNLQTLLTSDILLNRMDWKQDGLFRFCYSLLFRAGYLTLFGSGQYSPDTVYDEFRRFDGLLTKMARTTLKPEEKREAQLARERLWSFLTFMGPDQRERPSPWLQSYLKRLQEEGADPDTQRRALLMQLWATQGNTGPATFWLLGYLLTSPEAMEAVKREFEGLTPAAGASEETLCENLQNTPVFDSALSEALRLTAAPFITREVLVNTTLHMADGQEYDLRQGDRVCLFPYLSPQMDPEIHQEPEKYKYDRFLNPDGTERKDFFKGGQKMKYYTMPWGAGKNVCVGRHFAISGIKQFLFMLLTRLDLELCDPDSEMPVADASRYGFGMLQPAGDLQIRYRLKEPS